MNESLTDLNRFIQDFSIKQPNGAAYFTAALIFYINGTRSIKYSEVHIITSDNIAAVYFIDPALSDTEFPTVFDIKKDKVIYITGECLRIEKDTDIMVLIYPTRKN